MGLTRITAQQISNIDYKQSVRVVSVSNVTLAGGAPNSVDGVNLVVNDRILVSGQTTGSQNGLYYVTTVGAGSNGTWARSTDGDTTGEIEAGMIIMVTEGTTYADTQWKLTTDDPITIGTTALTFVQNYSANSISAGTSNVAVGSSANVTISSAGTANVFTVSSTGTVVSGTESVTGNITGGNIRTAGLVSATGSITGASVVGGVITGTSTSVSGTITAATVNAAAIGNVGAAITAATVSAATIGNASAVHNGTTFSASGTVTAASVVGGVMTGSSVSVTGAQSAASTVGGVITGTSTSVTGTTTAASVVGGVITGTSVSVSGNVTGGNILFGSGVVSGTGNVNGNVGTFTTHNGTTFSASGNITGGNITIPGTANISTFIGNVFFGSVPAQPTWYTVAPLNLNNSLAAATKVQLNLINTGGGAGAGSAIDFYTYQISVAAANAESRIAAIDDGNYSAYLSLQTKTPGSTGTNTLVERVKIDSTGVSVVANITGGNVLFGSGVVSGTGNINGNVGTFTTHNGTTFSASGNITGGNLRTAGLISATGNINGNIITATTLNSATISASGNITANPSSFFIGNGSQLTGIAGGGGGGSSITNGTSNITVALNSNITVGVTSASIVTFTTSGIVNNMGNGVGNIGNSTGYFNTVFAKATSAQYADVAEKYIADADYPVGTVLRIGGMCEVSQIDSYHGTNIIGTVSDKPAYVMNSGLAAEHVAVVALLGRVPCRVTGKISKGDLLVSSKIPGVATVLDPDLWIPGCVIGKSLEDYDSLTEGVIEIVVGRV